MHRVEISQTTDIGVTQVDRLIAEYLFGIGILNTRPWRYRFQYPFSRQTRRVARSLARAPPDVGHGPRFLAREPGHRIDYQRPCEERVEVLRRNSGDCGRWELSTARWLELGRLQLEPIPTRGPIRHTETQSRRSAGQVRMMTSPG
jgi:hypothetical protein